MRGEKFAYWAASLFDSLPTWACSPAWPASPLPVGSLLCLAPLALGLVPSRGLGVGGLPRPAPRPLAPTPPLTCPVVGPQMGRCSLAAVRRPAFGSEHSTNLILLLLSVFFDQLSVFEIRATNFIHPSLPSTLILPQHLLLPPVRRRCLRHHPAGRAPCAAGMLPSPYFHPAPHAALPCTH